MSSTNSTYINSGVSKEKSVIRINLMKKSLPIEKIKTNEKLSEYKKIMSKRMDIITRNKEYNKSYRERSKEKSIEKNSQHNFSCLSIINGNSDIKVSNLTKKIILKNKKQSLCDFLKKSNNKLLITKITQQKQMEIKK